MNYFSLAIKKLVDNFACYSDKLHEDYVYEAFNTIITQTKKGIDLWLNVSHAIPANYSYEIKKLYAKNSFNPTVGPRQEGRLIVDELNGKVEEARAKGVEDDTTKKRANEATKAKGNEFRVSQKFNPEIFSSL